MQQVTDVHLDPRPTVGLRFNGRVFPEQDRSSNRMSPRISDVPVKRPPVSARDQLADEIWHRLPFSKQVADETQTAHVIEAYTQSLAKLTIFRRDVADLMPLVCQANLEFRQQSKTTLEQPKRAALDKKLRQMIDEAKIGIRPVANVVNAELASRQPSTVRKRLEEALRSSVTDFVDDLLGGLAKLVDRGVVGLVEWTDDNVCRYHFFRQVVVQDVGQTEIERSDLRTNPHPKMTGPQWLQTVTETTHGAHIYRFARHEHHAINAFQTTIGNSHVVMPADVQKLVDQIPDWLRPVVRIIDGTLFRQIVIEQDLDREEWTDTIRRDEPVFGCEPAVVIDLFVLTGWGPKDIEDELDRRRVEKTKTVNSARVKGARVQRVAWLAAAIVTQGISLILLDTAVDVSAQLWVVAVLFCAGPGLGHLALREHAVAINKKLAPGQPVVTVLAFFVTSLGLHGLRLAMSGSFIIAVVSLILSLVGIGLFFVPRFRISTID